MNGTQLPTNRKVKEEIDSLKKGSDKFDSS